jgi:hypothetical protein
VPERSEHSRTSGEYSRAPSHASMADEGLQSDMWISNPPPPVAAAATLARGAREAVKGTRHELAIESGERESRNRPPRQAGVLLSPTRQYVAASPHGRPPSLIVDAADYASLASSPRACRCVCLRVGSLRPLRWALHLTFSSSWAAQGFGLNQQHHKQAACGQAPYACPLPLRRLPRDPPGYEYRFPLCTPLVRLLGSHHLHEPPRCGPCCGGRRRHREAGRRSRRRLLQSSRALPMLVGLRAMRHHVQLHPRRWAWPCPSTFPCPCHATLWKDECPLQPRTPGGGDERAALLGGPRLRSSRHATIAATHCRKGQPSLRRPCRCTGGTGVPAIWESRGAPLLPPALQLRLDIVFPRATRRRRRRVMEHSRVTPSIIHYITFC